MTRAIKLKSRSDFERIFDRGRVHKSEEFIVYTLPGQTDDTRIGVCVGKSLGSAVIRNRLRRQIWEIIRQLGFTSGGIDIVIVARKKLLSCDFNHIKNQLIRVLSRLQLVNQV